jgi:putative Ca2+/H+ antiporter (TMEM165/GDT1 family)
MKLIRFYGTCTGSYGGGRMDIKALVMTFGMIFLAELGDKTQLATLTFAAESKSRLAVFIGSAGALVLTSLLAVLFGSGVARLVPAHYVKLAAGVLFVVLGLWMIFFSGGR